MKGIILAGGFATRLYPNILSTSKQLLPVYRVPMVLYPLDVLLKAGIKDILIIIKSKDIEDFSELLEPILRNSGINIYYKIQDIPSGLPEAFRLGAGFIGDSNVTLILGDNIFEDSNVLARQIGKFKSGGHIFIKKVKDPERFAVAKLGRNRKIEEIIEKPKEFISPYAIPGLYIYDNRVIKVAAKLKASERKETEIVDLHKYYFSLNELNYTKVNGFWYDAGTPDALLEAKIAVKRKKLFEKMHSIIREAIRIGEKEFKARAKKILDTKNHMFFEH